MTPRVAENVRVWSYSEGAGDYHAENIRVGHGQIVFDFVSPEGVIEEIELGVPVRINIENGVAAMAAARLSGATPDELRAAMRSFRGPERRFDFRIKSDQIVFIDDYAHHPNELSAAIRSIKALYPDKKVTAVFQPHLYSRTRDFANEFAESLSLLEEVILLDIYPAREEPIEGVSSRLIFDKIRSGNKMLCKKEALLELLQGMSLEVLVTFGAGDIDRLLPEIECLLKEKYPTGI